MAEVTVAQLATTVGTPLDKLLAQMQDAGLSQTKGDEVVSGEDKKILLAYLKSAHGGEVQNDDAPKKITLKRKTLSTLKTSSGGRKTVNVEVRKKRTFVKRTPEEIAAEARAAEEQEKEDAAAAASAEKLRYEEEKAALAKAKAEARKAAEEKEKEEAERRSLEAKAKLDPNDPEVMRQLAAVRRKEKERKDAEERELARQKKEAAEKLKVEAAEKEKIALDKQRASKGVKSSAAETVEERAKGPRRMRELEVKKDGDDDRNKKRKLSKDSLRGPRGKGRGHNLHVKLTEDGEYEVDSRARRRKSKRLDVKREAFQQPTEMKVLEIEIPENVSVGDLAQKMNVKSGAVIKELMKLGVMANVNQALDLDTATLVIEEFGHKVKVMSETQLEDNLFEGLGRNEGMQESRAPVVTVMGHVDHGKTSLLDYIRKTKVASGEAGGITQHIGAYHVNTPKGMVTFLDTPGHAAFTAMRSRGAKATDIVVIVVAADDGVMPQTEEAVQHAKAAGVPIVIAINKMDKEGADPDRVKNELAAKDVIPEDWGGDVQFIPVSAHTGDGVDALLESILLQAELLELTAAKDIPGKGVVVESRLDKGRGAVATILIQGGILRVGDIVLAGESFGRVKAMVDENGKTIKQAGPSIPVEILGLNGTPDAGSDFFVVDSEKQAREVAEFRNQRAREGRLLRQQSAKLENIFENMGSKERDTLNVVLKTDVRGSLEALQSALLEIGNDEVGVNIVSAGVGGITESDASLALTSGAVMFGFNVRAENSARSLCEKEGVDLRYYSVIYDLIDDVKSALVGMLAPELREEIVGVAEVKDVFKSPKFGLIAGSIVIEGTVYRNKPIRVLRDNVVIYEGELESLRRFKDDVNEVRSGTECGIGVKNYQDVRPGDKIEVFDTKEIARTL